MTKAPETPTPTLRPACDAWTLDDLLKLPEDGNRYEIAHGSLLVTPPPSLLHVHTTDRLCDILKRLAPPEVR